jgi:tRNA U34 2-thiouridine synthase MnmA/TrmU
MLERGIGKISLGDASKVAEKTGGEMKSLDFTLPFVWLTLFSKGYNMGRQLFPFLNCAFG